MRSTAVTKARLVLGTESSKQSVGLLPFYRRLADGANATAARHGSRFSDGDTGSWEYSMIHHRSRKSWRSLGFPSPLFPSIWGPKSGLLGSWCSQLVNCFPGRLVLSSKVRGKFQWRDPDGPIKARGPGPGSTDDPRPWNGSTIFCTSG